MTTKLHVKEVQFKMENGVTLIIPQSGVNLELWFDPSDEFNEVTFFVNGDLKLSRNDVRLLAEEDNGTW